MTELGPSERQLLSALRVADDPTDEDRDRVHAAVLVKLAAVAGGTAKAATVGLTGAAAKQTGILALVTAHWKVALTVAFIGTTGGAGTWWVARSPAAPTVSVAPTELVATAPAVRVPEPLTSDTDQLRSNYRPPAVTPPHSPAAAASTATSRTEARARPAANGGDLDDELQLLGGAQRAIQQGDAERALSLLDEHAAEHPSGVLSQERAGVRAIALCRAGRLKQGRAAAKRFLAQSPDSPMAGRIRAACFEQSD